jgi:hypothetical protein
MKLTPTARALRASFSRNDVKTGASNVPTARGKASCGNASDRCRSAPSARLSSNALVETSSSNSRKLPQEFVAELQRQALSIEDYERADRPGARQQSLIEARIQLGAHSEIDRPQTQSEDQDECDRQPI